MHEVTRILSAIQLGDPNAPRELLPLVYKELRKLAALRLTQEKPGQTLQATSLVHEAYLRLVDVAQAQRWNGRGHFLRGRGGSHAPNLDRQRPSQGAAEARREPRTGQP